MMATFRTSARRWDIATPHRDGRTQCGQRASREATRRCWLTLRTRTILGARATVDIRSAASSRHTTPAVARATAAILEGRGGSGAGGLLDSNGHVPCLRQPVEQLRLLRVEGRLGGDLEYRAEDQIAPLLPGDR